jgi:RNA polymerase sigma-70 factor, ECF subfamily
VTSGDAVRRARFDALVREAYAPLRRYLARRTAADQVEDVLSDTLLVMWRRIDDVPPDSALPWCYGVARRSLANARRAEDRRGRLLQRVTAYAEADPHPGWAPAGDRAAEGLASALSRLSPSDREVLRLWAWEDLQPREMALVLGITANAASIRLHRATKRLRARLAGNGKDRAPAGQEGIEPRTEAPR